MSCCAVGYGSASYVSFVPIPKRRAVACSFFTKGHCCYVNLLSIPYTMTVLWLCVVCTLLLRTCNADPSSAISASDQLRTDITSLVTDLWKDVSDSRWVAMADEGLGGADKELLRAFQVLGDKLEGVSPHPEVAPALSSLWAWARAESAIVTIEGLYRIFRHYQKGPSRSEITWTDMATTVLHDPTRSVPQALTSLHNITVDTTDGDLFQQALTEINSNTCSFQQSAQLVIYNLYSSITLAELKGYAMMQFSWMLLRLYGKGNFTLEAEMMHKTYKLRARMKLDAARVAMKLASRHMWQCDPHEYEEGKTYEQLTRLLQGHIQNEVDLNSDNSCRENCAYYTYAKDPGCFDSRVCNRMPRCAGKLHDCRYIDSDMWICEAEKNSGRRYEGIRYENGRKLGQYSSCPNPSEYKVDSWWRWLFWHCSYCFCLCDEQGPNSDRFFNLRPVIADTDNNMVITGMRFTKVNRVIHLQIREGQLEPFGGINASSIRWRRVDNYSITDPNVENGEDYKTLSWEQRAIDLDDLEAPPGHVLTGVRFRPVGTHLNLEIRVSPFNFTSGTLIKPQEQAMWIGNDNTDASDKPRTQLHLKNPDIPTKTHTGSVPDSQTDQFVMFDHSDINNDAAQTTVPFLDAQPIEPKPPALLAGAGIYHKGTTGYGGFVAPKLITYDYSKHMKVEFPET